MNKYHAELLLHTFHVLCEFARHKACRIINTENLHEIEFRKYDFIILFFQQQN